MKTYAIVKTSTKKKIICDTGSINMRIRANEAYRFTDFRILRHNDVITILYWTYEFRFLGDLKESPSLGKSSHVMFSLMAKYSSLTAFYTFSEQQPKATEDKVSLHQS